MKANPEQIMKTKAILLAVSDEINFITETDYISARNKLIEQYDSLMFPEKPKKPEKRNIIDVFEELYYKSIRNHARRY